MKLKTPVGEQLHFGLARTDAVELAIFFQNHVEFGPGGAFVGAGELDAARRRAPATKLFVDNYE
jgi:hypothetical protein